MLVIVRRLHVPDIGIWQAELRVIEDVEGLRAELEFHPFTNREVFEKRHIPIPAAGSDQDIAAGVAIGVRRRDCQTLRD